MTRGITSLRRKIDSSHDLQAVVRAMKALAASSIGQYERSLLALADYYRAVELGLGTCLRQAGAQALPAGRPTGSATGPIGAVVFGSDQGLVGQFNDVIAEVAVKALAAHQGPVEVWAVGERVQSRLADAGLHVRGHFAVPGSVRAIALLVGQILVQTEALHAQHQDAELRLFYNRATGGSGYAPVNERLLPLDENWLRTLVAIPWPTRNLAEVLGTGTTTLRALLREFLFISLFRACAQSLASENASRLAAMERADRNIEELLGRLQEDFHRLRQSGIDAELFDLVAGFEAIGE